jgi:hypothetical protein
MCGYCVEGAILLDFLEGETTARETDLDEQWVSIYLQESRDMVGTLTLFQGSPHLPCSIAIAFCRTWDSLLQAADDRIYPVLEERYGKPAVKQFLDELRAHLDQGPWNALGDRQLYCHPPAWDTFLSDQTALVDHAEERLIAYHRSDLEGTTEDATEDAMDCENTAFFPLVFFSLCVLLKDRPYSEIIERIAVDSPRHVPCFVSNTLWLQRKAFLACVQQEGVRFILRHYDTIRLELVDYVLLKQALCHDDLALLNAHVLAHPHWAMGIDTDCIVERIAKQMASSH